jgi:hypothetical protein
MSLLFWSCQQEIQPAQNLKRQYDVFTTKTKQFGKYDSFFVNDGTDKNKALDLKTVVAVY